MPLSSRTAALLLLFIAAGLHSEDSGIGIDEDYNDEDPPVDTDDIVIYYYHQIVSKLEEYIKDLIGDGAIPSRPVRVFLARGFHSTHRLDEHDHILSSQIMIGFEFVNDLAKWDPAMYGNITSLVLPGWLIWKPNYMPLNSVSPDEDALHTDLHRKVCLRPSGLISLWSTIRATTYCKVDASSYPYDQHSCKIILRDKERKDDINLTIYSNSDISFTGYTDLAYYDSFNHGLSQWNVVNKEICIANDKYECASEGSSGKSSMIILSVTLARNDATYFPAMVVPCLSLVVLSTLAHFYDVRRIEAFFVFSQPVLAVILVERISTKLPTSFASYPRIIHFICNQAMLSIFQIVFFTARLTRRRETLHKKSITSFDRALKKGLWISPIVAILNMFYLLVHVIVH